MHQKPGIDKLNTDDSFDIQSELTRLTYESLPLVLFAVFINSSILSFMQWDHIPHTTIIAWYLVTNLFSLARLVLYLKFRELDASLAVPPFWQEITFATGVLSGATWSAAAIWLFPFEDIVHQTFLAFVVAGMAAGAVSTLSPMLKSLVAEI